VELFERSVSMATCPGTFLLPDIHFPQIPLKKRIAVLISVFSAESVGIKSSFYSGLI
jgi:hypothetical protein